MIATMIALMIAISLRFFYILYKKLKQILMHKAGSAEARKREDLGGLSMQ
jgi:hypothetical protein